MKVKIFNNYYYEELENEVNEFLQNTNIEIKHILQNTDMEGEDRMRSRLIISIFYDEFGDTE